MPKVSNPPPWDPAKFWSALDAIRVELGVSWSSLARRAGFDASTLNPSKQHLRAPNISTVDAILRIAGWTWADFGAVVDGRLPDRQAQKIQKRLAEIRAEATALLRQLDQHRINSGAPQVSSDTIVTRNPDRETGHA